MNEKRGKKYHYENSKIIAIDDKVKNAKSLN